MKLRIGLLMALIVTFVFSATVSAAPVPPPKGQDIDVVLCLDVSGSMNGLVNSAKAKLWDIVNDLGKIQPTPNLRVSLYSYGHQTYDKNRGWVRKEIDLTVDLDEVYKKLNALTLNGGNEYVTRVSKHALEEQKWSQDKKALRLIFVCGNESASQDAANKIVDVARFAVKKDVIINTIYCQTPRFRVDAGWKQLAQLAEGEFTMIDQDKGTVSIATPFDKKMSELSSKLNTTYLACGTADFRRAKKDNQQQQDKNAGRSSAAAEASRAQFKANGLYRNSAWDLVDRYKVDPKKFDLSKIPEKHLPKEMQKMKPKERLAFVKKKLEERNKLQKEIQDLSKKRSEHIQVEMKKRNLKNNKAFDEAIRKAVRKQAARKGLKVPKEK